HTRSYGDWSSDVCSSDLAALLERLAASRSLLASSASAWSFAFSLAAASIAALSAAAVVDGEGAAATLWREQALVNAAIESRDIERSVLLRMSPFTVKIRSQDDHVRKMATPLREKKFLRWNRRT